MKTSRKASMLGAAALAFGACAAGPSPDQVASADNGARIWRMTCARCHNLRPAAEYDVVHWPLIVNHMRTHQDLSRSDAEAVTAFLLSTRDRSAESPSN